MYLQRPGWLPVLGGLLAAIWVAVSALAGPVVVIDDVDDLGVAPVPAVASEHVEGSHRTSMMAIDKAMKPEPRTGSREIDLLLEWAARPARPDAPAQRVALPSAAAASAAAADLASLRLKAARLAASADSSISDRDSTEGQSLPLQTLGNLGTLHGDPRATVAERRPEWMGPTGGGDSGGVREPWREPGARATALDEVHTLLHLPRKVVEFLRDQSLALLAMVIGIALLGLGLKLYSRRI